MGALYIDEFAILFMKYAKGHVNVDIWKTEYSRYNLCCSMVGETAYKQQQKVIYLWKLTRLVQGNLLFIRT